MRVGKLLRGARIPGTGAQQDHVLQYPAEFAAPLKNLAARINAGDILLAVQTPDATTEGRVESLLREQGAVVAEKHAL